MIFFFLLFYAALGVVLISAGVDPAHWQYWAAFGCTCAISLVSDIASFLRRNR